MYTMYHQNGTSPEPSIPSRSIECKLRRNCNLSMSEQRRGVYSEYLHIPCVVSTRATAQYIFDLLSNE